MKNKSREYNKATGAVGYLVQLIDTNVYVLEDTYGNIMYLAKVNKKEKVQKLLNSQEFQSCKTIEDMQKIVHKHFNRKQ